tara:strand:- start:273 stop:635 length:363 start_codon:yes stop_codon:yes gene_type:complete
MNVFADRYHGTTAVEPHATETVRRQQAWEAEINASWKAEIEETHTNLSLLRLGLPVEMRKKVVEEARLAEIKKKQKILHTENMRTLNTAIQEIEDDFGAKDGDFGKFYVEMFLPINGEAH